MDWLVTLFEASRILLPQTLHAQSSSPNTTTHPPIAPVRPKTETRCAGAGQLTPAIDQV